VAVFVGDHIGLRKVSAPRMKAPLQLAEETQIQVHLLVRRTIEGASTCPSKYVLLDHDLLLLQRCQREPSGDDLRYTTPPLWRSRSHPASGSLQVMTCGIHFCGMLHLARILRNGVQSRDALNRI
jgi:hypothetical protein